jgi:transcription-repair coupling factor (superfamily II helicase)
MPATTGCLSRSRISRCCRATAPRRPARSSTGSAARLAGRKARVKQRIREIAGELIRVAAERQVRPARRSSPPEGIYEEFAARFPYPETEDQLRAIEDALDATWRRAGRWTG